LSYCFSKNCASDDPNGNPKACAANKANYEKVTGEEWMPCDIVACALCGDPDTCNQQNTKGICVEMKSVDCPEEALNVGEYPCDVVTIPADVAPGCSQIPAFWGLIPDCQYTGPAWVCAAFIGGVTVDKCPAPASCYSDCVDDSDCISEDYDCVDGTCALIQDEEVCDGVDNDCDGEVDEECGTCIMTGPDTIYQGYFVTPDANNTCLPEYEEFNPFAVPEGFYYTAKTIGSPACSIPNGPMTEISCNGIDTNPFWSAGWQE
jgi:hypothetical protein